MQLQLAENQNVLLRVLRVRNRHYKFFFPLCLIIMFYNCIAEEELKRLNEALNETDSYSAVGFSYENQHYMYDPEEPTPDPPPGTEIAVENRHTVIHTIPLVAINK